MRGEEGHVWKTVLRTVVAVQLQISHTSVVCVREHSDESKTQMCHHSLWAENEASCPRIRIAMVAMDFSHEVCTLQL